MGRFPIPFYKVAPCPLVFIHKSDDLLSEDVVDLDRHEALHFQTRKGAAPIVPQDKRTQDLIWASQPREERRKRAPEGVVALVPAVPDAAR